MLCHGIPPCELQPPNYGCELPRLPTKSPGSKGPARLAKFASRRYSPCEMFNLLPAGFVPPCLPTFARAPPEGPQWAYEIKHDGYRFITRRDGDRVCAFSRHGAIVLTARGGAPIG